jgi:copper transport protein
VGLLVLGPAAPAAAHASIERIEPSDGAVLVEAPDQLTVRFTETITEEFIAVELVAATVREIDLVAYRDPTDDHLLVVRLPVVHDGLYQVRFEVRDGEDLHKVTGRTSFAVGAVSASPLRPATGAPPSPFESASRWVFAAGLALLAGVLTFRGRWPDIPIGRPRRLAALAGAGLAAVVVGRLGVVSARALDLGIGFRGGLAHVARTAEVGQLPVTALAAACMVPAVAARWLSALDLPVVPGRRTSFRSLLGWIGVVWLAMLASTKDHSTLLGSIELQVAGAKALHLIGLAVWIGALVVALAVGGSRQGRISALAAVKGPALVGFVITVGSGLLLAGRLVASITGLLSTEYGLLLVAKAALIPVAIACGMMVRRQGPRFAVLEGALLGAVVAAGALMATAAPAVDHQYLVAETESSPIVASARADDLLIRLRAVPGRPGPNAFEIQVSDTRRPAPAPISKLEIHIPRGSDAGVRSIEPDASGLALVADVDLPAGETEVAIIIERDGLVPSSAVVTTRIDSEHYHAPVVVSSRPIRQPLRIAGALTLGIAAVLIAFSARARGREGEPCAHEPIAISASE